MAVILPTLDFSKFLHGTETEQIELSKELTASLGKHGFVKLVNHGVSDDFVKSMWHWGKEFFNMTHEQKTRLANNPGPHPQRGWSRKGEETTSELRDQNFDGAPQTMLLDEKEHFDCGPSDDAQYPNRWPAGDDLPGYREFMEKYFELAQKVALNIIRALEIGLRVPTGTLVEKCTPAASELRMLYYPPVSAEKLGRGDLKRAWPHTDFGIITLLFQDGLGGLEFENREKPFTFCPVIPGQRNEMVVNISDTFNRWSNGMMPGGLHQVNVPAALKDTSTGTIPERYSSVFFFKAHRDASVGPLKPFVTADRPAQYDDITALEFQRSMTSFLYINRKKREDALKQKLSRPHSKNTINITTQEINLDSAQEVKSVA